jgi:hypothetical protein
MIRNCFFSHHCTDQNTALCREREALRARLQMLEDANKEKNLRLLDLESRYADLKERADASLRVSTHGLNLVSVFPAVNGRSSGLSSFE